MLHLRAMTMKDITSQDITPFERVITFVASKEILGDEFKKMNYKKKIATFISYSTLAARITAG